MVLLGQFGAQRAQAVEQRAVPCRIGGCGARGGFAAGGAAAT